MNRIIFISGILFLHFVFYAEVSFTQDHGNQEIVIGWSGPLSGNSAVLGIDSVEAVRIAVDEANQKGGINGIKIKVIAEDDQYDTAKAVRSYEKLTKQDKAVAIVASTYGGFFATADRTLRDRVVEINPLDCNEEIAKLPEFSFCLATLSESIGDVLVDKIVEKRVPKVSIIYDESNPFMTIVMNRIMDVLTAVNSIKFEIEIESYSTSNTDFNSIIAKVKKFDPNSIVFLGHAPIGSALKTARENGIKAQFYTVGIITSPDFQKLAGESAEGTLVAFWEAPKTDIYNNFIAKFVAKTGRSPILEIATIPSYDSARVLIEALKGSTDSNGKIDQIKFRGLVNNTKNFPGISGNIDFDKDGAVRSIKEQIYEFSKGKLKKL